MDTKEPKKKVFYCTLCKKICHESGRWVSLKINENPETEPARFCLSLCPECSRKIFPKYYHMT